MKSKLEFNKKEVFKLALLLSVLGLITVYSKSISNYMLNSYNEKLELVANRSTNNVNWIRY
ncbi:hypothetical protein [Winogradskyella sp. A2]|uniref:hypothetical protein n=1 Tax=Winogradskyella sp. A2 TaxID=3366944 RepID=UPI00398C5ED8